MRLFLDDELEDELEDERELELRKEKEKKEKDEFYENRAGEIMKLIILFRNREIIFDGVVVTIVCDYVKYIQEFKNNEKVFNKDNLIALFDQLIKSSSVNNFLKSCKKDIFCKYINPYKLKKFFETFNKQEKIKLNKKDIFDLAGWAL